MANGKPGRPALPPEERRAVIIKIALTPAERLAIEKAALKQDLPFSVMARRILTEANVLGEAKSS